MRIRAILLLSSALLFGCASPEPTVVAPSPDVAKLDEARKQEIAALNQTVSAQKDILQSVSGDVYGVQNASTHLPPGNPTEAVKAQAELAAGKLPEPTPEQKYEKERQNNLFLTGQLDAARKEIDRSKAETDKLLKARDDAQAKAVQFAKDNAELRVQIEAANAQHAQKIAQVVADAKKAAQDAREEAYSERNSVIFYGLLGFAGVAALVGIALLVATQGKEFIRAGIAFGISGGFVVAAKTISHPWFFPIFWSVVALVVLAVGLDLWFERKQRADGAEGSIAKDALSKTARVIDDFKASLSAEQREKLKTELRKAQDEIHVNLIDKLRGKPAA